MFLLRDGSFTLMNIASLMFLAITIVLPSHNTKIVEGYFMACGVLVVYDGSWCSHMFPESFSKSSARLSNVLFFTIYPSTSVPVYHPTFLEYGVPVLGMYQ